MRESPHTPPPLLHSPFFRSDQSSGELSLTGRNLAWADRRMRWSLHRFSRKPWGGRTSRRPSTRAFPLVFPLEEKEGELTSVAFLHFCPSRALSRLEAHDPKFEPDPSILGIIRTSDLLGALWQKYTTTALLPLMSSSVGVRRDMILFVQTNTSRVEGKVNAILHKLLDGTSSLSTWLSGQLDP